MRASAVPTGVGVATPGLPATTLGETSALFCEWSLPSWGPGPWRRSRWLLRSGRGDGGEPVQPWAVQVPGTVLLRVVVLQAELATGGIARARPVKASLYRGGSGTDQFRSLRAGTGGRRTPTYQAHSFVLPSLSRPGRRIVPGPSPETA